jgi:hypothetical protein
MEYRQYGDTYYIRMDRGDEIIAGVLEVCRREGIRSAIFSGIGGCGNGCGDNAVVNRYEAGQNARIAELETEVKLRDANFYTLGEMGKMRDYIDRRFTGVEAQINAQAVVNAQVAANLSCMQGNIATLMGLTKTIVPITNVCPEPMKLYNSWTAPTAPTTGA